MVSTSISLVSSAPRPMRDRVIDYITQLQSAIVTKLETYGSGQKFRRGSWTRDEGGGGLSCTFPPSDATSQAIGINDHPIEKAGVNISTINGILPPAAVKQMSTAHTALKDIEKSLPFFAAGLSLIIHPRHPRVPGVHANYRYFEVLDAPLPTAPTSSDHDHLDPEPVVLAWWFGVITDLTPFYVNEPDFCHFHTTLKAACDCMERRPPHRRPLSTPPSRHPATTTSSSRTGTNTEGSAASASTTWIPTRCSERRWQLLRRGRAVEFNLVVDRGTKFGLAAPGVKAENVLVGLPPEARWEYCSEVGVEDQDTEEAEMVKVLKEPRNWAD
ncbi:coproporphyrinogen III oxidase [Butyriboletus roseoflavus]|nr:coproporphyrinogen III oxidase [Butyriboletus roseoflavus]